MMESLVEKLALEYSTVKKKQFKATVLSGKITKSKTKCKKRRQTKKNFIPQSISLNESNNWSDINEEEIPAKNAIKLDLKAALKAIKILNKKQDKPKVPPFIRYCKQIKPNTEYQGHEWNENYVICKYLQRCILKHEWGLLKELIKILMKRGRYFNNIKQVSFLNFLVHSDQHEDVFKKFVNRCFIDIAPKKRVTESDLYFHVV